jgi:FixJ family two-component response regulator
MPQLGGQEVFEEMCARGMQAPVIMISGHGDIRAAVTAMKRGAIDFLEKPYRCAALLDSVRRAIDTEERRRQAQAEHDRLRSGFDSLTPQEHEVLRLTLAGKPDKAIATKLDLSMRTVQLRRSSVMRKVNAHSRVELICMAMNFQERLAARN